MDPLSATANIAAILGLLDAVCRTGKETYSMIAAIKQAPEEIKQLKLELVEIDFLLLSIYRYCQIYRRQHPSMVAGPESAIGHIYMTLRKLKDEYDVITTVVRDNAEIPHGSTMQRLRSMRNKFKLVLGGKLTASFKILKKYKAQLSINLQLLAGLNDLAVHDRVESLNRAFSALYRDEESKTIIADGGGAFAPRRDITQSVDSTVLTNTVSSINQQSPGTWTGNKQHFERAALPLMLLRPKVQESLNLLTSHKLGVVPLPLQDANWIKDELECLLAICHESAAASLRGLSNDAAKRTMPTPGTTFAAQNNAQSECQLRKGNQSLATQFVLRESPTGKVSVRVQFVRYIKSTAIAVSDIILLLAPNPAIHQDGFLVSLSRLTDKFNQPVIHRSLSSFAVVEPNSPAFECVRTNDIHHLRQLLETRQATPDLRNTGNESLLSNAARNLRVEICELLIKEGADPSHCRWDGANAIYDVRNAFWYRPAIYNISKRTLNRMLRLFIRAGCDINSLALGGNPLYFTVSQSLPGSEIIDEDEISALVSLLVCLGCEIEHRNNDGLTPLLYNACIPQWHGAVIMRELFQWGADPHATTSLGEGPLHLAIAYSIPGTADEEVRFNFLRERLVVLLDAGCDPNLRDRSGHTPSDFAMSSPKTWFQWSLAVEKACRAPSIEHVLSNEDASPAPPGHPHLSTNEVDLVHDSQSVGDSGSDWESCSGSEDDELTSTDSPLPNSLCSHPDHIFLAWNGFFPWSIHPPCADCRLRCDLRSIGRRKWQALQVFRDLESQMPVE